MIPPIVGRLVRCLFRSSLGSSTKCLSLATLISEGVASSTTTNEVKKAMAMNSTEVGGVWSNVLKIEVLIVDEGSQSDINIG